MRKHYIQFTLYLSREHISLYAVAIFSTVPHLVLNEAADLECRNRFPTPGIGLPGKRLPFFRPFTLLSFPGRLQSEGGRYRPGHDTYRPEGDQTANHGDQNH